MRAIGIILAGGNSSRMGDLSAKRAIAAMPIAGSYRAIDFSLSNMSNSHIQKVAVFTQYNSRSLNEHLNSSKWWDFGRKQGGLYIITPTITATNSYWYQGTADALYQNINFLKDAHEPYVVIASGDGVYKLDYNKVLEEHIAKGADITVVTKDLKPDEDDISRFGVLKCDEDGKVIDFEEKPLVAETNTASIGVYVIRRRQLIELLEACAQEGRTDFVKDIIVRYKSVKKIYAYRLGTYWRNIGSIDSYFRTNMDFLKGDVRDFFFRENPGVYTKVEDLPQLLQNEDACIYKFSGYGYNLFYLFLRDLNIDDSPSDTKTVQDTKVVIENLKKVAKDNKIPFFPFLYSISNMGRDPLFWQAFSAKDIIWGIRLFTNIKDYEKEY